jgi:putative transposase
MSRFKKLSHVLWRCQYHNVWVPKYRHRVLTGEVGQEVKNCIQVFSGQLGCEVVELNIQQDHIHLVSNVPPKVSISKFMGTLKGRTAIRVFSKFPYLKYKTDQWSEVLKMKLYASLKDTLLEFRVYSKF